MAFIFGNGGPFVETVQNDINLTFDRSNASFVYLTLNVSFNSSWCLCEICEISFIFWTKKLKLSESKWLVQLSSQRQAWLFHCAQLWIFWWQGPCVSCLVHSRVLPWLCCAVDSRRLPIFINSGKKIEPWNLLAWCQGSSSARFSPSDLVQIYAFVGLSLLICKTKGLDNRPLSIFSALMQDSVMSKISEIVLLWIEK